MHAWCRRRRPIFFSLAIISLLCWSPPRPAFVFLLAHISSFWRSMRARARTHTGTRTRPNTRQRQRVSRAAINGNSSFFNLSTISRASLFPRKAPRKETAKSAPRQWGEKREGRNRKAREKRKSERETGGRQDKWERCRQRRINTKVDRQVAGRSNKIGRTMMPRRWRRIGGEIWDRFIGSGNGEREWREKG